MDLQALSLRSCSGPVVDALHTASDDAANGSPRVHASVVGAGTRLRGAQSLDSTVLRAHGIHARRAVGFLLDLPLGVFQEPPSVGKRIGREPTGIGLLCGTDRLAGVAHLLDRWRGHTTGDAECTQRQ